MASTTYPAAAPQVTPEPRPRLLTWLSVASVILFGVVLVMMFFVAPLDETQGPIQRIFYIHMPAFFGAAIAFLVTAVCSGIYLRTRSEKWDALAVAGVEAGLALGVFNVVSGMIWARPIWNTWWDWSPRLTTAAIMVLLYAAYLILRNAVEDPDRRARFAAVYGILAYASVILVFIIPRLVSDIHPVVIGSSPSDGEGGFNVGMLTGITLGVSFIMYIVAATTLVWYRFRMEKLAREVLGLKIRILSR